MTYVSVARRDTKITLAARRAAERTPRMQGGKLSAAEMSERREEMLRAAFRLFAEKNIESVRMQDIAEATDYTLRSLQRYFRSKENLVVAAATWSWEQFLQADSAFRPGANATAAERYTGFLDSFLRLYRRRRDILRFNQFFNVYVQSRQIDASEMQPYRAMVDALRARFHDVFLHGAEDGTLRPGVSEDEMFSTTLHLMLAAATRYAVGLAYDAGVDPERELLTLRDMLLRQYTTITQ